MSQLGLQTSLRDLASIAFRRKWGMGIIFFVTVFSVLAWVLFVREDVYEATARVLVKIGHEQAIPSTVLGERPTMIVGQRYQDVNSEVEILSSTDLIGRLVDELGLDRPGPETERPKQVMAKIRFYAKEYVDLAKDFKNEWMIRLGFRPRLTPREEAIAMIQKGLLVLPQEDSNVVVVKLFFPSRPNAAPVLNKLVELYQDFRLGLFTEQQAVEFFEQEVQTAESRLEAAEKRLHEFETQGDIRSIDDQKQVLINRIAEAGHNLEMAEVSLKITQAKVARFRQENASKEPDYASIGQYEADSFLGGMMLQLAELQKTRIVLEMAPVGNTERIEANRAQFNLLVRLVETNLKAALEEEEKLRDQAAGTLAALQSRLDALHDRELRWRTLLRDRETAENSYLFYRKKLEEASATAAMERNRMGSVEVIEHAITPLSPAGIRKVVLLAISCVIGVLAALAWASVREFFDHGVYEARTLEDKLGAPVLAVVPVVKGGSLRSTHGVVLAGSRIRN